LGHTGTHLGRLGASADPLWVSAPVRIGVDEPGGCRPIRRTLPYIGAMSRPWRWCLVVVLAATVLGGFMPQALLAGSHPPASMTALLVEGPPTFPSGCSGANCGRSAPVAPVPVLTVASLVAIAGLAVSATAGRTSRRIRSLVHALPRGTTMVLFRPPQFS